MEAMLRNEEKEVLGLVRCFELPGSGFAEASLALEGTGIYKFLLLLELLGDSVGQASNS